MVALDIRVADLADRWTRVVEIDDVKVLLIRIGDEVRATSPWCTHARTLLGDQEVDPDGLLECPLHGAVFDTADGSLQLGPACPALPVYPVTLDEDGRICVELPPDAGADAAAPRRPSSFGDWGRNEARGPAVNTSSERSWE
jgi:nitrite reductase/ring-hydroxylating ferredoxin subunit